MKLKRKLIALLVSVVMAFGALPVFATDAKQIEVVIEDISLTNEALPILSGEAKIKISISGLETDANIAQLALDFSGNMDYKAVQWLIEKDSDVISSLQVVPDGDILYLSAVFNERVIKGNGDEPTDICILTFRGEPGDSVFLSLIDDIDESYIEENYPSTENPLKLSSDDEIAATAIENGAKAQNAKVELVMNMVTDFNLKSENRNISITIVGEDEKFPITFSTAVEGNSNAMIPTLVVDTVLAADQTYTVRIEGAGYIPYEKTGVSFTKELKVENDEFIPGELIEDGIIDIKDKEKFEEILARGVYDEFAEFADFNRDGKVDDKDAKVYEGIEAEPEKPEKEVPAKMSKPNVTGGEKKIEIEWSASKDETVTGYTIKYGTNKSKLDKTVEISGAKKTSTTISKLSAETTYYVQIAAENEIGIGEFSEVASAKTNSADDNGGGGGGGTGGGGGFGGGTTPGGANNSGDVPGTDSKKVFKDLERYSWAEEAIYMLKDEGIINGVTDTTFAPGNNIKRGDFVLILARMLDLGEAKEYSFADVPESSYYYGAIGAAKKAGIATGDGVNFRPEESITRQDLITLAYRAFSAAGYIEENADLTSLDVFVDKTDIDSYAAEPLATMVKEGIIQGSDGKVNPKGNATRAEVAVMCARLLNLMD